MEKFRILLAKYKDIFKEYFVKLINFIKKWSQLETWKDFLLPENPIEHIRMVRFLIVTLLLTLVFIIVSFMISFTIVKTGKPKTRIPNVEQRNIMDAISILQSEKFKVKFDMHYDNNHEIYTVIKQQPNGGVAAREGREITLTVSLGKDLYEVPKLCGLSKIQALKILTENNIPYTIQNVPAGTNDSEQIIALNYEPGKKIDRTSSLILSIAQKSINQNQFKMENFINQPVEYVVTTLYKNYINPIIVTSNVESKDLEGVILSQNVAEGEILNRNNTVVISVGLYSLDSGEKEKMRWYAINYYIPKAENIGELQIITNEIGETNEIITPDAPTAKFYRALLEDELGRSRTIYEREGAEGTSIIRTFKAYGKAKVSIFADNEMIAERIYGE